MQNPIRFVLLITLAFIWGSSFILMKEGLKSFSPTQVAGIRMSIAGIFLLPVTLRFIKQIKAKDVGPLVVIAILGNGVPYFLFALAQTELGSAITGMLNSLVPLSTLIIAVFVFKTRVSKANVLGVGLGLVGAVLLVISSSNDTHGKFEYGMLVVLATICYGISVNTLKSRLTHIKPIATAAVPLAMVMIPWLIYLPLFEPLEFSELGDQEMRSLTAIAILGLLGTALAMVLFNRLIQISSAVFASSVTYLIPIVALIWGLSDHEQIGVLHFLGLAFVLIAVYLINKKSKTT